MLLIKGLIGYPLLLAVVQISFDFFQLLSTECKSNILKLILSVYE